MNRDLIKKKLILERVITVLMAGTLTLAWDANTEPDLAGYKIHYGLSSGNYPNTIDVKNVNQYTVQDLTPGTTYYFAATAYDDSDNQSAYSIELSHTTSEESPPDKPKGYRKK